MTPQVRLHAQTPGHPIAGRITLGEGAFDRIADGYVVEERFLSGTATRYDSRGALGPDGRWNLCRSDKADFTTRMVIVRPEDESAFNGTVVVEWFNVSGGTDAAPDWTYLHREIVRSGYAYVGVSAQKAGLDGGATAVPGVRPVKLADPERYGALRHPGDAFAFDIFAHAGRAIRRNPDLLPGLDVQRVIAIGESQSAGFLTTYINGIDPLERLFDGFLVHSRFAGAVPLDGNYVAGGGAQPAGVATMAVRIREDVAVPVLTVITETDLMAPGRGYLGARQDDALLVRTWELAGTAHADSYILRGAKLDHAETPIGMLAKLFEPSSDLFGHPLEKPMNAAPQHHYVMQAALAALDRWVRSEQAPASQPRLETVVSQDGVVLRLDGNGNALGGVRSPWMDVPNARLSGLGQPMQGFAFLFGTTEPFSEGELRRLYPGGKADYLSRFAAALEDAIAAGVILAADREEILLLAEYLYPAS